MNLWKRLFGNADETPWQTPSQPPDRARMRQAIEATIDQMKRLNDGMTVEALGALEEHGLIAKYDGLWEKLTTLEKTVDTAPLDSLALEIANLSAELKTFSGQLNRFGISKHILTVREGF